VVSQGVAAGRAGAAGAAAEEMAGEPVVTHLADLQAESPV
jgi:hypothetical protein